MVVTLYTIEGDPTTCNLLVEPDKDQQRRVVAEMEKLKRERKREKGIAIYDVVDRVQIPRNDQATLTLIPEGDLVRQILTSSGCDESLTEIT